MSFLQSDSGSDVKQHRGWRKEVDGKWAEQQILNGPDETEGIVTTKMIRRKK